MFGVDIEIDGDTAEVDVRDPILRAQVVARMLAAAGPRSGLVRVDTGGTRTTYRAPVEIVEAAGILDEELDAPTPVINTEKPEPVLPPTGLDAVLAHTEPPRAGAGSGVEVWRGHLNRFGIEFDPDDKRADLIARWDAERGDR